jgi:hypothetical protein
MVYASPPANMTVGMVPLFNYTNNAIGGILGLGILIAIEFIIFLALLQWGSDRAFAVTGVTGVVLSAFLVALNILNPAFVYLFIIICMIAVAYLYAQSTTE